MFAKFGVSLNAENKEYFLSMSIPVAAGQSIQTNHNRVLKLAAWAAFLCAACYATGLITIFFIEPGLNQGASERLTFILESGHVLQAWYFVIYVIFGMSLIALGLGLRQWLMPSSSTTLHISFLIGMVWAAYVFASGLISIFTIQYLLSLPLENQRSFWYAIYTIQAGLGEGAEWVGGLWMLSLHSYLIRNKPHTPIFNAAGLLIGLSGTLTMFPAMELAGAVFGVTQMIWFVVLGRKLLSK